jgi:SNF2 family DNA or RNA helicase
MNVEAFSTSQEACDVAYTFLKQNPTIMVVDESTRIKGDKAKRAQNIIELGKYAERRRILSGLPTPNGPLDLYSQMEFLSPDILGFSSYTLFKAHYAIERQVLGRMLQSKYGGWYREKYTVIEGYVNQEELRDKIAPYCFRKTKAECLDLPPKIWEREEVELTPEQKRIYSELRKHATSELEREPPSYITATRVITRMIRLHQLVCGYAIDEEGKARSVKHNRLERLMDILSEYKGKVVIWANYIYSINEIVKRIAEEYDPISVARYDGTNADKRNDEEERWKKDPRCRFMVATQQSGGLGNNWIEANLVIYYSNNYNLELRMQSEDRSHRGGQTKSVTYIDLVCPETVDDTIIGALRDKIDLDTAITGDNYRRWLI